MLNRTKIESKLNHYIRSGGFRKSPTRETILEILLNAEDHVDLSDLIREAKKRGIGEATVYRALKTLQSAGLVTRISHASGHVAYEVSTEHHDHMICTECGWVIEFHSEVIEKCQRDLAAKNNFQVHSHRHEIYGLCADCQKNQKKGEK